MRTAAWRLLAVLSVGGVRARKLHTNQKHRHAHTYLQFCANDTKVIPHACIHKVSAKWPQPARFDAPDCKEAMAPHAAIGSSAPACAAGSYNNVNIYDPITIAQALLKGDYRKGADVDTLTDWDRIRCRDGQLYATG